MSDFKNFVEQLNDDIADWRASNEIKEYIETEDVVVALVTLNVIAYNNIADVCLGCAAINLLNAYVKQKDALIDYQFKRHIVNLIKGIADVNQEQCITVDYHNNKLEQALLIVSFWNLQFSFSAVRYSPQIERLLTKSIEWDGIRKQPLAVSIFNTLYNCPFISDKTMNGQNYREKIETELELFKSGSYVFTHNILNKIKNVNFPSDDTDSYLKNYFRVKLANCRKRPVIVSGRFAKIWDKHITFTSICPYIEGMQTIEVCDHINIRKSDLEIYLPLSSLKRHEKYYIIGYCREYGAGRMGINLAKNFSFPPIIPFYNNGKKLPKDAISLAYRFSLEEYLCISQRKIKL